MICANFNKWLPRGAARRAPGRRFKIVSTVGDGERYGEGCGYNAIKTTLLDVAPNVSGVPG
jgi:hypothetical protein